MMQKQFLSAFFAIISGSACIHFGILESLQHFPVQNIPNAEYQSDSLKMVRVTAFNVQNLFDTWDDPTTTDEEFLPLKIKKILNYQVACGRKSRHSCRTRNWTQEALNTKLARIAGVLESENHPQHEILILTEVENEYVLRELIKKYRPKEWKTIAITHGPDPRGINIAILSTFNPVERKFHSIPSNKKLRGILETTLSDSCGSNWTVFGFHFPSQMGSERGRHQSLLLLKKLLQATMALKPNHKLIAGGDSNMTMENQSAEQLREFAMHAKSSISHFDGCADCLGTYWYRGVWSFFDWIFVGPSWTSKKQWTARVLKQGPFQMDSEGHPQRFHEKTGWGVSDHFPISVSLPLLCE